MYNQRKTLTLRSYIMEHLLSLSVFSPGFCSPNSASTYQRCVNYFINARRHFFTFHLRQLIHFLPNIGPHSVIHCLYTGVIICHQPKQCTNFQGKSHEITIHFHCLIPQENWSQFPSSNLTKVWLVIFPRCQSSPRRYSPWQMDGRILPCLDLPVWVPNGVQLEGAGVILKIMGFQIAPHLGTEINPSSQATVSNYSLPPASTG